MLELLFISESTWNAWCCLREDDEQVKTLWVGIKEQTSQRATVVGVCYRRPDQEQQVDEVF